MKILYVEDNPVDADLTRRAFKKTAPDLDLEVVNTQNEAMRVISRPKASRHYDLILTDIGLPDGDGLAILAQIRGRALPVAVVVITGAGDEEVAAAALKAGADDYVVKRKDYLTYLPETLRQALERFRQESLRRTIPIRVLYAEHNPVDIDLTERHLKRYAPNIRLEIITKGGEVLHLLVRTGEVEHFDLLLLDYRLPDLSALDLLKELKGNLKLELPVIIITGKGDEEVVANVFKIGAIDYVVKHPGYLFKLSTVLENAFHGDRWKREHKALKESQDRLHQITENMSDLISQVDKDWIYQYVSPSHKKVLGYEPKAMVGHSIFEFMHPEEREAFRSVLLEACQKKTPSKTEFRYHHAEGRYLWFEAVGNFLTNKDGQIISAVFNFRETTERKRMEEALRVSLTKYKTLFESLPFGVTVSDNNGLILEGNKMSEKILGLSSNDQLESTIGGKEWPIIRPDGSPMPKEEYASTRALKEKVLVENVEMGLINERGAITWINVTAAPILLENYGVVVAYNDISDRKQAEKALKGSLKEKEVMLREIHHRVKNNLQVVQSLLNLQAGKMKEPLAIEAFRESRDRIRSMALVHEKLYQAQDLASINLSDYLKNLGIRIFHSIQVYTDLIQFKVETTDVYVGIDIAVPVGLIVNELISNALKHAFPFLKNARSEVKRRGEITLHMEKEKDCFILICSDNGIGLPGDVDFNHSQSLGFVLIKSLVEQLEGSIVIHREEGTEFRIRFPGKSA